MKSKIMKILSVVVSVTILTSMLVSTAMALSTPSLTIPTAGDDEISKANADYTVIFTINKEIAVGGTIILGFPSGYTLAAITGTLATGPGWVLGVYDSTPTATGVFTFDNTAKTVTVTVATEAIGEGAQVRINITAGITNPSTAGDYAITVKTSVETTAVSSNTVTLKNPVPPALPGVVKLYNASGVVMTQATTIAAVIAYPPAAGFYITLTAGTYAEDVAMAIASVAIRAADGVAASDVIIKPATAAGFGIAADKVVVQGVTIDQTNGALAVAAGGTNFTVKDCILKSGAGTLLTANAAAFPGTIDGCTFNVTGTVLEGVDAGTAAAGNVQTIKNSTFNVDAGGTAIQANGFLTVTSNTITGASGIGLDVVTGTVTATKNTLKTLTNAVKITTPGTLTFTGNTVDACGVATANEVFDVVSTGGLKVTNNVITNSKHYVADVTLNDALVVFLFNDLSGSAKGFNNAAATVALVAYNNYWGAVDPAATGINSANVDYTPKLGAVTGTGTVTLNGVTATDTTLGVVANVYLTGTTTAPAGAAMPAILGVSGYAGNPTGIAIPATVTAVAYFDAVVTTSAGGAATDDCWIKISGTTANPIVDGSNVYIYNAAFGRWDLTTLKARNTYGNYIEVMVETADLTGTPIVLTTTNPTAPAAVPVQAGAYVPLVGAINFPTDGSFSWQPVAGAVTYDFELIADSAATDKFAGTKYITASTTVAAYKVTAAKPLAENTVYWWRVRAVNAVGASAWTVGMFTTAKPVTPALTPAMGAVNVPIDFTFSWTPVVGATSYDIVVAEDSSLADKFSVINYSATSPIATHKIPADQVLKYNTLYWWRVRANTAAGAGAWTVSSFTTEKEPVVVEETTAAPPVVITTAPAPEITLEIPASPSPVEPIPSYLLWAVVAVGAVLVIAVIVLIVRTRRIS